MNLKQENDLQNIIETIQFHKQEWQEAEDDESSEHHYEMMAESQRVYHERTGEYYNIR